MRRIASLTTGPPWSVLAAWWRSLGSLATHIDCPGNLSDCVDAQANLSLHWLHIILFVLLCLDSVSLSQVYLSCSTTKPAIWHAPNKDSDQPGHLPNLISLRCALNGLLRTQALFMWTVKIDQSGQMPGWSASSLGAKVILLNLSWGGSFHMHIEPEHIKTFNMMCAERRLGSASTSEIWSVPTVRCIGSQGPYASSCSKDSIQTEPIYKLIRVFIGYLCNFVGLVMLWLIHLCYGLQRNKTSSCKMNGNLHVLGICWIPLLLQKRPKSRIRLNGSGTP